jgi:hypothetical protein
MAVLFFKRAGVYYVIYSSCCCCCTAGAGAVVYRATALAGPWHRQGRDVNCRLDVPICAGMKAPQKERPMGGLIIPAQGFNVARFPGPSGVSSSGEGGGGGGRGGDDDVAATYLWSGERWLSGPFAPSPHCVGDCAPASGTCARDPRYRKGHEFTYCKFVSLQR